MNSDFSDLLVALNDAGAEYLVVGGYAVGKHTEPRYTKHLDVWINNSRENAELVLQALAAYGAPVNGATADDFTGTDKFFQIGVEPVRIDVISDLPGVDFSECWENRVVADVDGLTVNFISLPDLIRNKELVGRPRDLRHVKELRKNWNCMASPNRKRNEGSSKPVYLERICLLLNCTPNDLFDWRSARQIESPRNPALAHPHQTKQRHPNPPPRTPSR